MKRILIGSVVASLLWLATPAPAYACSGFVDCLFGFSERTEIRNERMVEVERIKAQAQADQARIEAEAQAAVAQAQAEVERIRQQQWANEAQRDVAIAQAQALADQYKAMVEALTREKIAGIESNAATQIQALQAQAEIATAGILETGKTERWRIAGSWSAVCVALLLAALVALYWMKRQGEVFLVRPATHTPIGQRGRLPWYSETLEITEVRHANHITPKR